MCALIRTKKKREMHKQKTLDTHTGFVIKTAYDCCCRCDSGRAKRYWYTFSSQ